VHVYQTEWHHITSHNTVILTYLLSLVVQGHTHRDIMNINLAGAGITYILILTADLNIVWK